MSGLLPSTVKAVDPYYIAGTVIKEDTNQTVPNTNVYFYNIRTQEERGTTTDSGGSFVFDLANFQSGWIAGDYIEVRANAPSGYHGYKMAIMTDYTTYQYHTWNVHPTMWPVTPNPPWSNYAVDMHVACRQSTNIFSWYIANGQTIQPAQSGGTIWVKFGYTYYEDGATGFPDNINPYDIKITVSATIKDNSDGDKILGTSTQYMQYTSYYGAGESQKDPIITLSLQHDVDLHLLTITGCVSLEIWDHNTQAHKINYEWMRAESRTQVKYDW
jgi:hypothetical protein